MHIVLISKECLPLNSIGVVSHYVIWFDCFEYTIHQQVEKHFEEIEQFFLIKKQHLN